MKSERGSVTSIVGITMLFIFILLDAVFTSMYMKNRSQVAELTQLQNAYDGDMKQIYIERAADELSETGK